MRRAFLHIVLVAVWFIGSEAQILPNLGGQRVGISSLQFLKIGVGARGAGMGESMAAVANDISGVFWNPAGVVLEPLDGVMAAHTEWLVDMKHDFLALSYHLSSADVVALSVTSLRTEDMAVTTETHPFGTGEYFKYSDLALGFTYVRQMTSQFSFGATAKYVEENAAAVKIKSILFDLGTYYSTGLGSLRIGVVVTNFGGDVAPSGKVVLTDGSSVSSFQSFSPPTLFKVGVAFEPIQSDGQYLTTSIQLNHPNDNAENFRFGVEYGWGDWFRARAGLKRTIGESWVVQDQSSAEDYSLGLGVIVPIALTRIAFDYGFTNFNLLGGVHRISLTMAY